jgi:ABC-type multidrug transport system fused ATPase/permease subunit
MLGLLTPASGQILIDGVVLTQDRIPDWQATVGFVPQDIILIDDSIWSNIGFGIESSQIDRVEVKRAARQAQIEEFIETLPAGFDTIVGERGVRLSGGQRQRIGIARALYRNPSVLIFDEATSALDSLTEKAVMDSISFLSREKTILLVAHRLSTLVDCSQIFVLENGSTVDQGTYTELAERNNLFKFSSGISEACISNGSEVDLRCIH